MGKLIVVQFMTLDGVVEDPDGSDGTPFGGWAMRHGPEAVAGDKFRLGPVLDHGTLLFGRRTWEHFSALWPRRDDPFSKAMNGAAKAVVTSRPIDPSAWAGSRVTGGPPADWARRQLTAADVVVIGSGAVVSELAGHGLVDEYRLLIFPTATGSGRRLFPAAASLRLVTAAQAGPAVLATYSTRPAAPAAGAAP